VGVHIPIPTEELSPKVRSGILSNITREKGPSKQGGYGKAKRRIQKSKRNRIHGRDMYAETQAILSSGS